MPWPLPPELDAAELERLLFPPPPVVAVSERPVPLWAHIHQELRRKGVSNILKTGADRLDDKKSTPANPPIVHDNIRGPEYYH